MNNYDILYRDRCDLLFKTFGSYRMFNEYEYFKEILSLDNFIDAKRNYQRKQNKRYRTKNKILLMYSIKNDIEHTTKRLKTYMVFGTLTLNDYYLSLKENTYIRKIHQYLKDNFYMSILNKDYGDKTNREHYHFIGFTTRPLIYTGHKSKKGYKLYKLENDNYDMGHNSLAIIETDDIKKLNNYLLKLNYHSNKDTTRSRVRVLYNSYIKENYDL